MWRPDRGERACFKSDCLENQKVILLWRLLDTLFFKMGRSVLKEKSYLFAIRIVNLCRRLQDNKEYVISKQLIRSGSAIGAQIREAEFGQSRADFANKMSVALKEANETEYWLLLLRDTGFLQESNHFQTLRSECRELIAMLVATVKTAKTQVPPRK